MRSACVADNHFDILGVVETHLTGDQCIDVDGYTWYGRNRSHQHVRARVGSGGVGFLVNNELLNSFSVVVLNDENDDILWLKLDHVSLSHSIIACVCYLPPDNSSRQVDVHSFFDNLLTGIYTYQSLGTMFICGDFNSRCGAENDFILGVDNNIPQRDVVDFKTNTYGHILIDFLVNCNMCILNGRNCTSNDFTSISTKGSSVVDYCFVNHEDLCTFQHFQVMRVTDMVNKCGSAGSTFVPTCLPDHSCLKWCIEPKEGSVTVTTESTPCGHTDKATFKYDYSSIPDSFLKERDVITEIDKGGCVVR